MIGASDKLGAFPAEWSRWAVQAWNVALIGGGVAGVYAVWQFVATEVGPAVSGSIYAGIGHRAPFAIGALIMALTIGVALLVARAPRPAPQDRHHA